MRQTPHQQHMPSHPHTSGVCRVQCRPTTEARHHTHATLQVITLFLMGHTTACTAALLLALCGGVQGAHPFSSGVQQGFFESSAFDGNPLTQFVSLSRPSPQNIVTIGYQFDTIKLVSGYSVSFSSGSGLLRRTPNTWKLRGSGGACGAGHILDSRSGISAAQWEFAPERWSRVMTLHFAVASSLWCSRYQLDIEQANTDPTSLHVDDVGLGELYLDTGCAKKEVRCWDGSVYRATPSCSIQACPPCTSPLVFCHSHPYEFVSVVRDPENNCQAPPCPPPQCNGDHRVCPDGSIVYRAGSLSCNFVRCAGIEDPAV